MLSKELLGKMGDVNRQMELVFPFGYVLDKELEEKYFKKGSAQRAILIRNMIVVDNSFKKFQIFPTQDIMQIYIETQKELLLAWQNEAIESFIETSENKNSDELDDFKTTVSKIALEIEKISMPQIKQIANSEEAKMLENQYNNSPAKITDIIQNTISNFFK